MTKEELLKYLPLVKNIARKYKIFAPETVEFEDIVHWGIIGLLEAEKNFSSSKGNKFITYAYIKIKGAIIDNLRKVYPLSPYIISQINKITKKINELEEKIGRSPTEEEICESLNITVEKYREILKKMNSFCVLSLEELQSINPNFFFSSDGNWRDELSEVISLCIEKLTPLEKLIISLYYKEELTLKEIGKVLNLTEARVSQIHKQVIIKLRSHIEKYLWKK